MQLTTNSLPLARALILRKRGLGLYTKIGYINEIEQRRLRYIPVLSPALRILKMGVLVSSRSNPSSATHLMCRAISKSLSALRLDS